MKKTKLLLSLLILFFCNLSHAETYNAWDTVNSVTYPVQALWINAFGSDNKANLYQVGSLAYPNDYHWFVRKSTDGGYTWYTTDELYGNAVAYGFAADKQGNVFVAGRRSWTSWYIRKSTSDSSVWSEVDNYSKGSVSCLGIAPNGDIYAGGTGYNGTLDVGVVRKSSDGGKTWDNVDLFDQSSAVTAITFDSQGNVYEIGNLQNTHIGSWYVRMSSDNGKTWSTVDIFNFSNWVYATAAAADSAGNIYVTGYGYTEDHKGHWLVRKGNKKGSWTTVDDFIYPNTMGAESYAITIDKNDVILVAGGSQIGKNGIVRMSMNGGATWSTMDDFPSASPTNYRLCFHGIHFDNQGHLYTVATGQTFDSTPWHIVTRKFFGVGENFKHVVSDTK